MKQTYHGSCHCGAIQFDFESEPIKGGLRCNCSICSRKGALMTPDAYSTEEFKIEAAEDVLGLYQFGSNVAKHYFCKNCGIYTFHETMRMPGHYRANLGCVDGIDVFSLDSTVFDGKNLL